MSGLRVQVTIYDLAAAVAARIAAVASAASSARAAASYSGLGAHDGAAHGRRKP